MRRIIQGGLVCDGTGSPAYQADVLLDGDRIARIAPAVEAADAQVIHASGCIVAPGFVDIHRHCDLAAFSDERFGPAELAQGITTVVGGNCGLSCVPMTSAVREHAEAFIAPCLGPSGPTLFADASAYLSALEQVDLRVNMGMLAGLGAIKTCVKGFEKTPFTQAQLDRARGLIKDAMEAGMLGLSTGVMYPPECYNQPEDFIALLSAAAPYARPLCCHIRGEGDGLLPSVLEAIDWGRRSGVAVHISHFKCTGLNNWGQGVHAAIEAIEKARAEGLDVTVDFYPYDAGATTLVSLLPPSVLEDDNNALWKKLGTPAGVAQVRQALEKPHPGWDNMIASIGWKRIFIGDAKLDHGAVVAEKDMETIAAELGMKDAAEALCAILHQTNGNASVLVQSMSMADVHSVARLPYACVISDALYGGSSTHPRRYGAFSRVLRELVRAHQVLSLEAAIHKMTQQPAALLHLDDCGVLAPDKRADITLFSPSEVQDHATYREPERLSSGMRYVLVGGEIAWQHEAPRHAAGRLLRSAP